MHGIINAKFTIKHKS